MEHYDYNKVDEYIEWCRTVSNNHDVTEAFQLISNKISTCPDRYLNDFIAGLNFIQNEKSLDWIETNTVRIKNIGLQWGHLAASSNFTWKRAYKWLLLGRPLSLIALDGLLFCTTVGDRLNQSPWMQELNPKLKDNFIQEEVSKQLKEYLIIDKVPRTRVVIEKIINNIHNL